MIDYKRPFTALRRDPRWIRKILLGALITLIPYVGVVWLLGWQMQYQRNVAWGRDEQLPEWSDFKSQMLLGFYGFIAVMPYSLLLSFIITPLSIVSGFVMAAWGTTSGRAAMIGTFVLVAATALVTFLFMLLIIPLSSSATLRVALYGSVESGLQFREIFRLMRERKRELNRAWWFAVLNTGISFGLLAVCMGGVGLMFLVGVAVGPEWFPVAALVLTPLAYLLYMVLATPLSVVLGVANSHYFAHYGRIAYALDAPAIDLNTPSR